MSENSKYDGAKFNSMWLALGIGVGAVMGVAIKNIAVGVGVGAAIGISLAVSIPTKKK